MYTLPDDLMNIQETMKLISTAFQDEDPEDLVYLRQELYLQQQKLIDVYTVESNDDGYYDMRLPIEHAHLVHDVAYALDLMEETLEEISQVLRGYIKRVK